MLLRLFWMLTRTVRRNLFGICRGTAVGGKEGPGSDGRRSSLRAGRWTSVHKLDNLELLMNRSAPALIERSFRRHEIGDRSPSAAMGQRCA
jgi:hypothetical protein